MAQDEGPSGFDSARAELFEALGHPTRVRILTALGEQPLGFSELKRRVGIESSGHMSFHLGRLDGLVKTASNGSYTLTDDGREALRLISAMDQMGDQPCADMEARSPSRRRQRLILAGLLILLAVLGPLAAYGAYFLLQAPVIVGVVDHKSVGHGLEDGLPITWYTVSIRLATDDPVTGLRAGETLAYIVEKQVYDRLNTGDLVKGIPRREAGPRLELLQVVSGYIPPS